MSDQKKTLDMQRREMPKQEPQIRRQNFDEVAFGYPEKLALEEASRCLNCKKPQCVDGCPVGIHIPEFIQCIVRGDYQQGIQIIKESNCLPAVCGRVCPQESQCEGSCILNKRGGQIAIGRLERFLADWEASQPVMTFPEIAAPNHIKVAIVGGGPAGLTTAGDLVKLGYDVTLFEALHRIGGVLVYGIPEFRLPKKIVNREVEYLQKLGVKKIGRAHV